jgi:hypothetical protein
MKKAPKAKPISKAAKLALKKIDKAFPSAREKEHPFVLFTKLLVIAKDCEEPKKERKTI